MKNNLRILFAIITTLSIFNSCSSSEETQIKKQEADSIYVFDEIPPENIYTFETPQQSPNTVYIVQIGAFSTMDGAKQFADFSRVKLKKDIRVNFNEINKLYVIQIHPPFSSREEAETYRNEIWNYEEYRDAWIVTLPVKK
jgi:cell division septation protein DedD